MKQGDIYWYAFRAPDKRRPVLLLTRNSAILLLTGITIAPLTTTIRDIPSEVILTPEEDGVPEICVVNTDNLQTIQKENLGSLITHLSQARMSEVREAIKFSLGFDALE
ncbi:MAG: type II toxin-antitoxin system toxin endoribonuclease MazF3 [Anaerolineales bacterium]